MRITNTALVELPTPFTRSVASTVTSCAISSKKKKMKKEKKKKKKKKMEKKKTNKNKKTFYFNSCSTDRPTYGRKDTPSYRDARTHLKIEIAKAIARQVSLQEGVRLPVILS